MKVICFSKTKCAASELHLFHLFTWFLYENPLEPDFLFSIQKERLILDGEKRVTLAESARYRDWTNNGYNLALKQQQTSSVYRAETLSNFFFFLAFPVCFPFRGLTLIKQYPDLRGNDLWSQYDGYMFFCPIVSSLVQFSHSALK